MIARTRSQICVDDEDGRHMAVANIEVVDPSEVRASLHVESGHVPVGTRARLVDAVLDNPEVSSCEHVQMALLLGDTEILDRVRERCDTGEVRRWNHLPGRGRPSRPPGRRAQLKNDRLGPATRLESRGSREKGTVVDGWAFPYTAVGSMAS